MDAHAGSSKAQRGMLPALFIGAGALGLGAGVFSAVCFALGLEDAREVVAFCAGLWTLYALSVVTTAKRDIGRNQGLTIANARRAIEAGRMLPVSYEGVGILEALAWRRAARSSQNLLEAIAPNRAETIEITES